VESPDTDTIRRRYRFGPWLRVRRKAEFERALKRGPRATDERLTVWAHPNGLPHPRLGLIVGIRHGNAPARNRLKRVLRSAFRLSQHELPAGLDLICTPRAGRTLDLSGCRESLLRLARRLRKRLDTHGERSAGP